MNKFLLTLAMFFAAMTVGVHAQKKVNRMVVHQKDGAEKTYVLENVDSVTFQKSTMKGGVTVSVMASTIAEEGTKKITKALGMATLPPGCRYGEMALIPDNGSVTDISAYIKSHCIQRMNATSNQWTVTGFDANTNYLVGVQAYTDDGDVISYGTAELSIGDGSVYDLGEGANTYIVPEKGKYSFMPMHVDGTLISGFTKVDWLWSTKAGLGNKQNLVSNIAIDESTGRVTFEATGKKGSVVLAAFDDAGKVVWTWLLWCTDRPENMRYENGVQFMDRCIGATSANPEDGTATWGLVWQWGRPTPFFGGYAENEWNKEDALNEARSWTVVNSAYDFKWERKDEQVTMEEAIASPMTFFIAPEAESADWYYKEDLTRWSSFKTNYDPCPSGYRLPTVEDLFVLNNMEPSFKNGGYVYEYDGKKAWWPALGGGREFDSACNIIGSNVMCLWTGSAEGVTDFYWNQYYLPSAYRFMTNNGQVFTKVIGCRAFGHAIRGVVDNRRR